MTASQSRSSVSRTAIGFRSTPKRLRASTVPTDARAVTRCSRTGRRVARSAPSRKAPEPTAGSSTVISATSRRTLNPELSSRGRRGFHRAAEPARQVGLERGIDQLRHQMHAGV